MENITNWTIRAINGAISTNMSPNNIERYAEGSNAHCIQVCETVINIRSNVDRKLLATAVKTDK